MRLKSRQRQIPGGMFVYVPETRFKTADWSSFDSIVDQIIAHRNGNPAMAAKYKWATDRPSVEAYCDHFIANVCAQMGYKDFIVSAEAAPPSLQAPSQSDLSRLAVAGQKVRDIWAGLKTIGDWIDSNAPTVSKELAESRAAVCVACPKNGDGNLGAWFIAPVAGAIKPQVEKINARGLTTSNDEKLGVCEACTCAMKVKVWVSMEFISTHTSAETMDKLRTAPACWIIAELAKG